MESPETHSNNTSWLKNNILTIIIIVLFLIFAIDKLNKFESYIAESNIPSKVILDFQNKSGVTRIKTSFTDILVSSAGSKKRGDGYELLLLILNPSSIPLRSIKCDFWHSSGKTATCEDLKMIIFPGKSRTLKCFISDLSDSDLKYVEVSVDFDQISHY